VDDQRRREEGTAPLEYVSRARYEVLVRRLETMNAMFVSTKLERAECLKLRSTNENLQERVRIMHNDAAALQLQNRRFEDKARDLQVFNLKVFR
jgi:hypothetical protein